MSLTGTFNTSLLAAKIAYRKRKRTPPFSLRLTDEERQRLLVEAAGAPLGTYIKAKVLGEAPPSRTRRSGLTASDRSAFAQGLAQLGNSGIAISLRELALAAETGSLPLTPETEAELFAALQAVRELRCLFLNALGFKPEDQS